jgi:serine/threonine protein kinase/Tol biopolymer transport system component
VVAKDSHRHADGSLTRLGPGSRVAGYLLENQIGAGGMAVVFRARDERLGRLVALKVLAPGLAADESFRLRFIRESRAAAAVDDPHIIPVYDAGEASGVLFIAMRLVVGGDLRSVMRHEGQLSASRAAALLSPVASALDAAHGAGLVHRDVKPGNVLVDARPGRPEHVYLSDFGLSKGAAAAVGLTGSGQFMGTAEYAAPEQINGRPVDGQADQYALACMVFEALTGTPPFARPEPMAVLWAHLSEPPPSLAAKRPDLPPAVDRALARALAKEPHHRYPSCRDFTDALREALGLAPYSDAADSAARASAQAAEGDEPAAATAIPPISGPRRGRHSSEETRPHRPPYRRIGVAALAAVVVAATAVVTITHAFSPGHGASGGADRATAQTQGGTARNFGAGPSAIAVNRVATFTDPRSAGVDSAAFSPDGRTLATADHDGSTYLWDIATGHRVATLADPGSNGVQAVAFSANGKVLATADLNSSAYLWDLATRSLMATLTDPGLQGMDSAAFGPRGSNTLATADQNGSTYLWDIPGGNLTATLTDPGSNSSVYGVAFSTGGMLLATADISGHAYLWNVATDSRVATLTGPGVPVYGVAFSPDGKLLATADQNGSTYLWNVATGRRIATLTDPGSSGNVTSVAFSPNGKTLATGDQDGNTYLWDVAVRRRIATLTAPGSNSDVSSVAFSPNGKTVAAANQDGNTYLWRLGGTSLP